MGIITGVGVLDKGMALLDCVQRHPMTASELAHETEASVSTAHRLAMAMTAHGLLRRDGSGRFSLGPRFDTRSLAEVGEPIVRNLSKSTGESATIWVPRGDIRVCIASVDSDSMLRASLPVWAEIPLLKGSPSHVLRGEVNPRSRSEESTICGWYEVMGERTKDLGSVSAPIYHDGLVVAAICVAAPISRLLPSPGQLYGKLVVEAARTIEANLGWA